LRRRGARLLLQLSESATQGVKQMIECYIEELGKYVDQEVRLKGWVYNLRSSGKIRFIVFRDGTGTIQVVLVKAELPEEIFELRSSRSPRNTRLRPKSIPSAS
jgi:asparaginyl-tRNA synthetase